MSNHNRPRVHLLTLLLACLAAALARADEKSTLPGVKRIVFLGDSITYAGAYVEDFEAWLVTRLPERSIEIINVGLPSETVSGLSEPGHAGGKFPRPDLHERLDRVLAKTKPDLVIACYGMICVIYLPFAEERFQKFADGQKWLHEKATAAGAKIIHVTPPVFDENRNHKAGYADTLDRYSDWLLAQRAKGWDVADLHTPMRRFIEEKRKTDPGFFLAGDGVHPGEPGHWLMAQAVLAHIGAKDAAPFADAKSMLATHPHGAEILGLVQKRQRMMKDAWLTETGHTRPGMAKGLPLDEAKAKDAEIERQIRELAAAK